LHSPQFLLFFFVLYHKNNTDGNRSLKPSDGLSERHVQLMKPVSCR